VPPALPQPVGQLPVPVPPPLPTSAAPRPYPPAPTATGDPTAVARPGDVTRLDAAPGPGGGPLGAGPSVGGPGAGAPGGWSRRRLLVAGGAVVAVALVAALTWNRLTRDEVLTTGDHHARVAVPHGWTDRAALPFPGADDTGAGARASSGARSVSLAYTVGTVGAAQVLARAAPPSGCTPGGVFDTGVGSWKGLDVRWTGCPGGATVDDVVIAGPAGNWTVWLEVTAVGGVPDLPSVVASLDVSP